MQLPAVIEYLNESTLSATPLARDAPRPDIAASSPVSAQFSQVRISSTFQPVVARRDQRVIGYEALLRGTVAGQPVSAETIFAETRDPEARVTLDRLCRAVHTLNFIAQDAQGLLFLNVHPDLLATVPNHHGEVFEQMLRICHFPTRRVVLEIPADAIDEGRLRNAVRSYHRHGYRVALTHLGRQPAPLLAAHELSPEMVKLDPALVAEALRNRPTRNHLLRLIEMLHTLVGTEVAIEGVETRGESRLAEDIGADLVQGFYYQRPHPVPAPLLDTMPVRTLGFA